MDLERSKRSKELWGKHRRKMLRATRRGLKKSRDVRISNLLKFGTGRNWSKVGRERVRKSSREVMERNWESKKFRKAHRKATLKRLKVQNARGLASRAGKARGLQIQRQWKNPTQKMISQMSRNGRRSAENHPGVRFGPSGSQVSLFRRLCRLGISGLKLEHRIGRYSIDIAHVPTKTAIECDGKHWHKNHKYRDRVRDKFLRKLGWKTLRFKINNRTEARSLNLHFLVGRLL